MPQDPITSTDWLETHLGDATVRVIDCRGYVVTRAVGPGVEEADYLGAYQEYLAGHIPGASYVDWTADIIDPDDPVRVQVAGPERFAQAMAERGVGDDTHVVAVDHTGGQYATRLWWALRYYGHDRVTVLEGGWNRWVDEERPTEAGPVQVAPAKFTTSIRPELRKTADDINGLIGTDDAYLFDARDAGQYLGSKRRGSRGGHIPGALHVPREWFFAEGGGFKPTDEVKTIIEPLAKARDRPIIAYCNGGVAATIVLFNLFRLGIEDAANYDGSWNEWSERVDLPTEISPV